MTDYQEKMMNRCFPSIFCSVLIGLLTQSAFAANYSFHKDVLPILQENCQECHRSAGANFGGMVAPMSLTSYEEVRPWSKSIVKQIQNRDMPPWDADLKHVGTFRNERHLTDEEIQLITDWVNQGAKRGNPKEGPEPLVFNDTDGWTIGDPDLVVTMPEPYHVTDDVYDQYTAFTVDLTEKNLPEDMYITAFQCKPDSKVIHHFNCHLLFPDKDGKLPPPPDKAESSAISPEGAGTYLGGISSGSDPNVWPEGFGIPIKKGTRVTFDIHYHKEPGPGTGVYDQSSIGFKLTKEKPTRVMGGARPMMHFDINIEPGDPSYKIGPISQVLRKDIEVVALMPHMHMRGKTALFEAVYPDGTHEELLRVPEYDFAWQTVYYYDELKRLPKGTKVSYTAWFDNSPEFAEKRGFDPKQPVTFGQKSSDEMMMGFLMSAEAEDGTD
jgi:hypothetical protein